MNYLHIFQIRSSIVFHSKSCFPFYENFMFMLGSIFLIVGWFNCRGIYPPGVSTTRGATAVRSAACHLLTICERVRSHFAYTFKFDSPNQSNKWGWTNKMQTCLIQNAICLFRLSADQERIPLFELHLFLHLFANFDWARMNCSKRKQFYSKYNSSNEIFTGFAINLPPCRTLHTFHFKFLGEIFQSASTKWVVSQNVSQNIYDLEHIFGGLYL